MNTKTENNQIRFASGKKFVQSIRHQGLSDEDAVKELADNSFDANADQIWVEVWSDGNAKNILVQDDGRGMTPSQLWKAPAFGESDNPDISKKIGRFGFGLPTAIASKTKTADIFSKTDKDWYYTCVDLDKLEADPNMLLQQPVKLSPKEKYGDRVRETKSGTIVVLRACDRLHSIKPETVAQHLQTDLEETYRHFIAEGKKVFVNGARIGIDDPLMLMKGHKYYDELRKGLTKEQLQSDVGYAKQFGEIDPIEAEYTDQDGTPKKGLIRIKLVLLPIEDIDRTGGSKKYDVGYERQGFYLVRNRRQIGSAQTLGVFNRHPMRTHFRGEIDFDSALDTEFGVQVNKSRFTLSKSVKDKIRNATKALIRAITKEQYTRKHALSAAKEKDSQLAEKIAADNPIRNPKHIKSATDADVKKAIETELKSVEKSQTLTEETKKGLKTRIRAVLESEAPFFVESEVNRNGPLFNWQFLGKTTKVVLNRDHPFYRYFWVTTEGDPYFRTLLKLLIFTLVKGEQHHDEELEDGHEITYEELQNYWSQVLRNWLESADFKKLASESGPDLDDFKGELELED